MEEEEANKYIAFVDSGNESYDVLLKFDDKNEIILHKCDCPNEYFFCEHKAAVLIAIIEQKGTKRIKLKKKSIVDEMVLNQSQEEVNNWVINLLKENKSLLLAFQLHFSPVHELPDPKKFVEQLENVVKSELGRKRSPEKSELKQLISHWDKFSTPLFEKIATHFDDKKIQELTICFLDTLLKYLFEFKSGNNQIERYIQSIEKPLSEAILLEARKGETSPVLNDIINYILLHPNINIKTIFQNALLITLNKITDQDLKNYIIDAYFKFIKENKLEFDYSLSCTALNMLINSERENQYMSLLPTHKWQPGYNLTLIKLLIKFKKYQLAESHCKEQIKANSNKEYNIPYLQLLRTIYLNNEPNNSSKLIQVLTELMPESFNFEDYLYIVSHCDAAFNKRDFRNKIYSRAARLAFDKQHPAYIFRFRLLIHEKESKKLFEKINTNFDLQILLPYWNQIYLLDNLQWLSHIFNCSNYSKLDKDEENLYIQQIESCYTSDEIYDVLNHTRKSYYLTPYRNAIFSYFDKLYPQKKK